MPKTILMLAANPDPTARLRLSREFRDIELGMQRAPKRDDFKLVTLGAVRSSDVRRAMLDNKPNIVHFCGHGEGPLGLVLEDDNGGRSLASNEALAGLFKLFADHLECIVLNACYSEVQAAAIVEHIPYVIGMSSAIEDTIAIEFSTAFYDAVGAGRDIEDAFKMGCNAIQFNNQPPGVVPVLKKKPSTNPTPAPVAQDGGIDPYRTSSGLALSLATLPDVMREALKKISRFLAVFGSGRFPESSGRVGLVSDCLYVPEIITSVQKLVRDTKGRSRIDWSSALDIDLVADLKTGPASQSHLLLAGTGDINAITAEVFRHYESCGIALRPGCSPPYMPTILGTRGPAMTYDGVGLLILCVNPWNTDAVCIIAAGTHAAGTTAALYLLREYLEGRAVPLGNNRNQPSVPSKVFNAAQRVYRQEIKDKTDLVPQEDLRNINDNLQRWIFKE